MIVLINVYKSTSHDDRIRSSFSPDGINLGLHLVAQSLRKRFHQVEIIDAAAMRLSPFGTFSLLCEKGDSVLAIGLSAPGLGAEDSAIELATLIKNKFSHIPIVLGGYSTLNPEVMTTLPVIDVLFRGEAEERVVDVFDAIIEKDYESLQGVEGLFVRAEGEMIDTGKAPRLQDLSKVQVDYARFRLPHISTSRNCYGKCNYCSIHEFYNGAQITELSLEEIARSIRDISENDLGSFIDFQDDTFLAKKGVLDFVASELRRFGKQMFFQTRSDLVLKRKEELRRNRDVIAKVSLGYESASNGLLHHWNKKISSETNNSAVEFLSKDLLLPISLYLMLDDEITDSAIFYECIYGIYNAPWYLNVHGKFVPFYMCKNPHFFRKQPCGEKNQVVTKIIDSIDKNYSSLNPFMILFLQQVNSPEMEIQEKDRYTDVIFRAVKNALIASTVWDAELYKDPVVVSYRQEIYEGAFLFPEIIEAITLSPYSVSSSRKEEQFLEIVDIIDDTVSRCEAGLKAVHDCTYVPYP